MLDAQQVPWVRLDVDFPLNTQKNVLFPWGKGRGRRDDPDLPHPGKHNLPYFLCSVTIDGQDRKWSCPDYLHAGLIQMGLVENMAFQVQRVSTASGSVWQVMASDGQWYSFERPAGPPQGSGHAPPQQNVPQAPAPPQQAPAPPQQAPAQQAPPPPKQEAPPPPSYDINHDIAFFDACVGAARVVWEGHFPDGGFSFDDLYKTAFTIYKSGYGKHTVAPENVEAMKARLS